MVKNLPENLGDARDVGLIPGSGSTGEENGNLSQYSCWEILHGLRSLVSYSPVGSQREPWTFSDWNMAKKYLYKSFHWPAQGNPSKIGKDFHLC